MIGDKILIEEKCKELGFKLVDSNFDYDENRDAVFEVICLNCGKKSTKTFVTLVKKESRCKFCYSCNDFLLEKKVKNKLIERNIIFEQQKKFE